MRVTSQRSRFVLLVLLLLGVLGAGVATSAPSGAQEAPCNAPYGCPPTVPPGRAETLACSLDPTRGTAGTVVTATVTDVVPADGNVNVTFDGVVVGSAAAAGGTARIEFTVPSDARNGAHAVAAVAPNGSANCGNGNAGFTVVAAAGASRGGGGSLARAGITISGLLLAAAVLILGGRAVLEQSRRRNTAV